MNHWYLVFLDILVVIKYFAPSMGSILIFVIVNDLSRNDNKNVNIAGVFGGVLISVVLYCWGMK